MNIIEFMCWEKDKPLEIQLEPEAFCYTVNPGSKIRFISKNSTNEFSWVLRIDHSNQGIQLFPSGFYYEIEIYINDELIENIANS